MHYDFDKAVNRLGTNSIKWEFIHEGKSNDLLPLWIADMDFSCPQPIRDAIHDRIDKEIFGYSVPLDDYYSAVQKWFSRRFDWNIKREDIVTSIGIVPALGVLIKTFTKKGDGIIIQKPAYQPFSFLIEKNDRHIINNALLNVDGEYLIDFEDLEEQAKKPTTSMLIFCSPHNPVGRVWTRSELTRLIEICLKHDVMIVSDEIHCDLLRKGVQHTPLATLSEDERIVTCTAPSKSFNIAGFQMANIIIRSQVMRDKWKNEYIGKSGLLGKNPISICAVTSAYTDCESWLDDVNGYIEDNFVFLKTFLNKHLPRAKFTIPGGTFFAWIDFSAYFENPVELEKIMIEKAGVALSEGYTFGGEGAGFERLNVACSRAFLESALEKIKDAIVNATSHDK